jgi:hypothetical protein
MRKNILWMLAAILTCGLTVTTMTACSSSDDDKTDGQPQKEILYVVKISDDVLKVANVEVNYVDQTGAKKKESMTSTMWTKKHKLSNATSLNQGIWAKITPKTNIQEGTYLLKVISGVACKTTSADGKISMGTANNNPDEPATAAKTADEIAAWCAKSPTSGLLVDPSGSCKQQHVDFGGNSVWDEIEYWWCVADCWRRSADYKDCDCD